MAKRIKITKSAVLQKNFTYDNFELWKNKHLKLPWISVNVTLFIWIYCDWKVPSSDNEKQLFYNVFSPLILKLYDCSLFTTYTLFRFRYTAVQKIVCNTCFARLEKLSIFPPKDKKNQLMSRETAVCLLKFSKTSNA